MRSCRFLKLALAAAAALSAATVMAQGAGRGQGSRAGGDSPDDPAYLLVAKSVQQELELTEDQLARLEKLRVEEEESARTFFRGFIGLSQEQIQAKFEKRAKASRQKISKILTPPQMDRLSEINIQRTGVSALGFAEVAKAMELTAEQQEQLAELGEESRRRLADLYSTSNGRPPGKAGQQERQQKQNEIHAERNRQAIAVLTSDQKERFEKLQGEPFDTSTIQPRRRSFTNRGRIEAPGAGQRPEGRAGE